MAVVARNTDALGVTADWSNASCSLEGAAVGTADAEATRCAEGPSAGVLCASSADCGAPTEAAPCTDGVCDCAIAPSTSDLNLALHVEGTIVNQPPIADAGADRTVECNIVRGARFLLDGTGSSDVDGNLADQAWFRGGRTAADAFGWALLSGAEAPLGSPTTFRLRVLDAAGQASEDTMLATVVDTTPPVPSCNLPSPATIVPPSAAQPVQFTATAADVCDPAATARVSDWSCFNVNKAGKRVLRTDCKVTLSGGTITISDSGGVDAHIAWTASATDASGNTRAEPCEVVVVRPPPK
jgi:hypothetical protein